MGNLARVVGVFVGAGLILALGGCATSTPVRSWTDGAASLGVCEGFGWLPRSSSGGWRGRQESALNSELTQILTEELIARGCPPTDRGAASYLFLHQLTPPSSSGYGSPGPVGTGSGTFVGMEVDRTTDNRLYLEAREAATGQLVWRAWAGRAISPREDPGPRLREAVRLLLDTFPPFVSSTP